MAEGTPSRGVHPRIRLALAVAALIAVAVAVGGTVTGPHDATPSRNPLAGRPVVRDQRASVSYRLPAGWTRPRARDLPLSFSSAISAGGAGGGAIFLIGRLDSRLDPSARPGRSLAQAAADMLHLLVGFFVPDAATGSSSVQRLTDAASRVGGRAAWNRAEQVRTTSGAVATLRLSVWDAGATREFLLGVVRPQDERFTRDVDRIAASVRLG